jgi:SagB-type dehydrogenase family enzyme
MATRPSSHDWYLAEAERGQQLLDAGQLDSAAEIFEAVLTRLGDAPSYGRAVMLERLGRCSHFCGRADSALTWFRKGIGVTERLAASDGVKRLRGVLHSDLGDALLASGQRGGARAAYEAALKTAEELKDLRGQGVDLGHLGALALSEGNLVEALERYRKALKLLQQLGEPAMEAVAWHQLGRVFQEMRQWDAAEQHYRKAIDINRKTGDRLQLRRNLINLADLLQHQTARLVEARELANEALAVTLTLDPATVEREIWKSYGTLACIADKEAASTEESQRSAALQLLAHGYRQLAQYAPRFLATLARLGETPSCGRAVILERLGRCLCLGGRPDLAVVRLGEAMGVTDRLTTPTDGLKGLRGTLHSALGDALRASGRYREAREAYEAARTIAEELQDLYGAGTALSQLGALAQEMGQRDEADRCYREVARLETEGADQQVGTLVDGATRSFDVTVCDDLSTDYVFDPDLLIDGRRERKITKWIGEPDAVANGVRPTLVLGARTCAHGETAVRFYLPPGEPIIERQSDCTIIRRTVREVVVSGNSGILWGMIRGMDGTRSVAEMVGNVPVDERGVAARMLASLAAAGAVDISGRPVGRFLHSATKKGVVPGGGLESDEVLELATDGNYRAYPEAPRIPVGESVPDRLRSFHALTRSRRSRRDYHPRNVRREDFDALLYTACGVTGVMPWAGREVKLRAYPASGALYAVEIYPVVFRVEGLKPGVYHYRAVENALEVVKEEIDLAHIIGASLPVEREMVAGAAAIICLAGFFPRHERKYGQGGYRMLVAEAGHISQNLVLAATALGLSARPFGGVFDDVLNHDLGLDGADEQFLLAVLVGHTGAVERNEE